MAHAYTPTLLLVYIVQFKYNILYFCMCINVFVYIVIPKYISSLLLNKLDGLDSSLFLSASSD